MMGQLRICDIRNPYCPYTNRTDSSDNHCFSVNVGNPGYEVIAEDHPDHDMWLATVRGIDFDVVAKHSIIPELPFFIPGVRHGSGKLFKNFTPPFVCVSLSDVISAERLLSPASLHDWFGVPGETKIILLAYGRDKLIEDLWPRKQEVLAKLATLNFSAVTAINYSIWDNQPHAERLINQKRSLLTFEDWQNLGVPAIPHTYWYGKKDIEAWVVWINKNTEVKVVAVNLQTAKLRAVWDSSLRGLEDLAAHLERPVHFLVTGPSTPDRIRQLKSILPSFTLTNGRALRAASKSQLLLVKGGGIKENYVGNYDKSDLALVNSQIYHDMMALPYARPKERSRLLHQASTTPGYSVFE